MGINIGTSFNVLSNLPIDDRLVFNTKADFLTVNDNTMPNTYLCTCNEDGKLYLYDKSNTANATTGKFRVFEGGGDSAWEGTMAEWEALSAEEKEKYETVYITDDYTEGLINDAAKSANTTYSSNKIESLVDNADTSFTGTHAEWESLLSAEKAKYTTVYFTDDTNDVLIDDNTASNDKVYSSSKVQGELDNINTSLTNLDIRLKQLKIDYSTSASSMYMAINELNNNLPDYTSIIGRLKFSGATMFIEGMKFNSNYSFYIMTLIVGSSVDGNTYKCTLYNGTWYRKLLDEGRGNVWTS